MTEEYLISCQNKLDEIRYLESMIGILKQSERSFFELVLHKRFKYKCKIIRN